MTFGLMLSGLAAAMFAAQLQPGNSGGPLKAKGPDHQMSGDVCPVHPAATAAKPGSGNSGSGNVGSGTITGKFVRDDAASAPQAEASTPDETEQVGSGNTGSGNLGGFNSGSGNLGSSAKQDDTLGVSKDFTDIYRDTDSLGSTEGTVGEAGRDHIIIRDEAASAPQAGTSTAKPSDCAPDQSNELGDTRQDDACLMCEPGDTGKHCC